ncbi:phage tail protein [Nocardioides bizhenqiangii]|uniref:Tail fiber protein n=1 Tax=Nocardioides bizhenqiangii TaxID=3095076 RepID=A0ABZ0ZVF0_9ACTN|nr:MULTISPECIES: tail fiber protein [unclassified Nocardioides]MDZ5623246.1 tail fiber protein [Nocardioides sp. HM23]WQQ28218.1 tail fiber protein [Nocardioides sp. HM61]
MSDQFLAEIRIFTANFPPTGWAYCNGQLMPISQNTALFALLGTTYGGDGKSTFALPNLMNNAPMQPGQDIPGLSNYDLGQEGGVEFVTLLESEMPAHAHSMNGASQDPALAKAVNPAASWALSQGGGIYQDTQNTQLSPQALSIAGGSLPHNNLQPYLTLNFCIALQGIFPSRWS